MRPRDKRRTAAVLAAVVAIGAGAWIVLARPAPPPPAPVPPPPPPKWECRTAYGAEVCERTLPPAKPAP